MAELLSGTGDMHACVSCFILLPTHSAVCLLLCGRPNGPYYASCPSVRPSVCVSRTGSLLPSCKLNCVEKPKLAWPLPGTGVTGAARFGSEGQRSGGRTAAQYVVTGPT